MNLNELLIPAAVFAGLGGLFGGMLAVAGKIFAVKTDPRLPKIKDALPGANCGACGYSGCDGYAEALCRGEAAVGKCAVGGKKAAEEIAALLGVEGSAEEKRAVVLCSGRADASVKKYRYEGPADCLSVSRLAGGDKLCPNGCIGLGTCQTVCQFGAITVKNGVAAVDAALCTGCGKCADICPKHIIRLLPKEASCFVGCASVDNGKVTNSYCKVGCISCRICEKKCPAGAITVNDFVASVDQSKCTHCGLCVSSCPRHIIHSL